MEPHTDTFIPFFLNILQSPNGTGTKYEVIFHLSKSFRALKQTKH